MNQSQLNMHKKYREKELLISGFVKKNSINYCANDVIYLINLFSEIILLRWTINEISDVSQFSIENIKFQLTVCTLFATYIKTHPISHNSNINTQVNEEDSKMYLTADFIGDSVQNIVLHISMKSNDNSYTTVHKFSSKKTTISIGAWCGKATTFLFKASILDIEYGDKTKEFTTQIELNKYVRYECNYSVNKLKGMDSGYVRLLRFGINGNWSLGINPCNKKGDAELGLHLHKLPSSIASVVIRRKLKFEVNDKIKEIEESEHKFSYDNHQHTWKGKLLASSDLLFMKKFHCIVDVNIVKIFGNDGNAISPYEWEEHGIVDIYKQPPMDNDDEKTDESVLQEIEKLKEKLRLLEKKVMN